MHDKNLILQALNTFARQRPGLEFANYGDVSAYRSEMRGIRRDLAHVKVLMRAVERSGISGDKLLESSRHAYSGRLTIKQASVDRYKVEYCTGQYFPTEYRRAVCAVLSSALWDHYRDSMTGEDIGNRLRGVFHRKFGRVIANLWFA